MKSNYSEAMKVANLTNDWRKALEVHQNTRKSPTMDWLGLEATLRAFIKETQNHDLDKIVAEFTGRGYELPCPKCGQILHLDDSCLGFW